LKAACDIAAEAARALDDLTAISVLLASHGASSSASFSTDDIRDMHAAVNDAIASLKKILVLADAIGGGPSVPPARKRPSSRGGMKNG